MVVLNFSLGWEELEKRFSELLIDEELEKNFKKVLEEYRAWPQSGRSLRPARGYPHRGFPGWFWRVNTAGDHAV